jgi:PAS domain S-box-containing protein
MWIFDTSTKQLGQDGSREFITDRRPAEETLTESQDRLALALDTGHAGLAGWDARTNTLWWNARMYEILGYEVRSFVPDYRSWHSRVHPEDIERVEGDAMDWLQQRRKQYSNEYRIVLPDGEVRWVRCAGGCEYAPDGAPVLITGIVIDITGLKRAEDELRRARDEAEAANEAKDEFLAMVSHELRTPLGGVLLWAKLLKSGSLGPEKALQALDIIIQCAEDQTRLVHNLLDTSRFMCGNVQPEIGPVNWGQIIEVVATSMRPEADAKAVKLDVSLCNAVVSGDAPLLRQVVRNLLSNAIKFTPKDGCIQITLTSQPAGVQLVVADNGEGISQEFLPHVFKRFCKTDNSPARHHGGLGLGLSIVQSIVQLHGGSVSIQSDGIGQGSTVTVTLPVYACETEDGGNRG